MNRVTKKNGIPKGSKDVENVLLRSLMYRPAARVAAIFDIILVILCTAYVAFGTIRVTANMTVEKVIVPDEGKAYLFFNFGNHSPMDLVDQCKKPHDEGIYSALQVICAMILYYITAIILPLFAAFGLLQSTTELSDMDLKTKLMHVRFWICYCLSTLIALMIFFGIYGFPECEVPIIGIAIFRLLFVFFVMKYADEMKDALEQAEDVSAFIPAETPKVLIEGKK